MTGQPDPDWLTKAGDQQEFFTNERCHITEILNSDASPSVSVALARVEPGVTTQLHSLSGVTEVYVIKQGGGVMQVGDDRHPVNVGDQIVIDADVAQCISNDRNIDLVFYCVCTPRFSTGCYVSL